MRRSSKPLAHRVQVTVYEDDFSRVTMARDEDGDVEIKTQFREGSAWRDAEAAPTVVSALGMLAGLLDLDQLGIAPRDVPALRAPAALSGVPGAIRLVDLLTRAAAEVLAKRPATGHRLAGAGQ